MGRGNLVWGQKCARYTLIIFNSLFFVFGLAIFGFGVSVLTNTETLQYLHISTLDASDGMVRSAANLLITVGIFILVTAFIGCFGAFTESTIFLLIYIVVLSVILFLQFVAGITAATFKDKFVASITEAMNRTMHDQYGQPDHAGVTEIWNLVQTKLECCGVDRGPYEWKYTMWGEQQNETVFVPPTCCRLVYNNPEKPQPLDKERCQRDAEFPSEARDGEYVHLDGCKWAMERYIMNSIAALIGVAFGLLLLQVIGLVLAFLLRRSINSNYEHM